MTMDTWVTDIFLLITFLENYLKKKVGKEKILVLASW